MTITDKVTVDQLRRQLIELIRSKRQRASSEDFLRSLEEEIINEEKRPILVEPVQLSITTLPDTQTKKAPEKVSDSEVMATIRRWDLTYDGGDNLMEFIERLEELAECYGFDRSRLLFALLEILRNRALQWYRVKREYIDTWDKFKEEAIRFFLPKRYLAHLEENIYHRKQGNREQAKDYILSFQALIRQHPDLRKVDHTDRIYDGLRYEYRLYVRRRDFTTLDELMELTDEYEVLRKEEAGRCRPQPNHHLGTSYNQQTVCWKCKQIGHTQRQCRNQDNHFISTRKDITKEQKGKLPEVLSDAKSSFRTIRGPCNMGTQVILKTKRKPTRPFPPGKIKGYLQQTKMPRHVPAYIPPFEARPRVQSVENAPVAQSGEKLLDQPAKKIWDARKDPLHAMTDGPPPLAPLSRPILRVEKEDSAPESIPNADDNQPTTSTPQTNSAPTHSIEEVFLEDVLNINTPDLSEGDDTDDDLFRGITIRPPVGKRHKWMIYPKGRPKVEVTIRNGVARLRCKGKEKVYPL